MLKELAIHTSSLRNLRRPRLEKLSGALGNNNDHFFFWCCFASVCISSHSRVCVCRDDSQGSFLIRYRLKKVICLLHVFHRKPRMPYSALCRSAKLFEVKTHRVFLYRSLHGMLSTWSMHNCASQQVAISSTWDTFVVTLGEYIYIYIYIYIYRGAPNCH